MRECVREWVRGKVGGGRTPSSEREVVGGQGWAAGLPIGADSPPTRPDDRSVWYPVVGGARAM